MDDFMIISTQNHTHWWIQIGGRWERDHFMSFEKICLKQKMVVILDHPPKLNIWIRTSWNKILSFFCVLCRLISFYPHHNTLIPFPFQYSFECYEKKGIALLIGSENQKIKWQIPWCVSIFTPKFNALDFVTYRRTDGRSYWQRTN